MLKALETIYGNLEQIDDLEENTLNDYIITLKEYQKHTAVTDEGKSLFKKAKEISTFLQTVQENIKKDNNYLKEPSFKEQLNQTRPQILVATQIYKNAHQERTKAQEQQQQAQNSLREQLVKADMVRFCRSRA